MGSILSIKVFHACTVGNVFVLLDSKVNHNRNRNLYISKAPFEGKNAGHRLIHVERKGCPKESKEVRVRFSLQLLAYRREGEKT